VSTPPDATPPLTLRELIDARGGDVETADLVFLRQRDRTWTFREYRGECLRYASFLLRRLGPQDDARPGHVAMLLENHLELLALYGGCGYAGLTLFGINTGLQGDTLAGVLNQSRARVLIVDEALQDRVERVRGQLEHLAEADILVLPRGEGAVPDDRSLLTRMDAEVGPAGTEVAPPPVEVTPATNLVVIYTSGTTGLPKGINNNHMKLLVIGMAISRNLELTSDDCGYACMPLFHSNALFLGFHPALFAGASLALRERFSAGNFVADVFEHGVTWWNYVGEPLHYILNAITRDFDGDEDRILAEVAGDPRNKLRYALGNGASPPDIDLFTRWLGLEDMLELYGSTEAAISTFRRKGDPRGCVGEVADPAVKILDEDGRECPLAELDADGKISNYAGAVGEICRVAENASLFQGYFDNPQANESKFRDGIYHSGDLGHMLEGDGKRFLYFDGRTDDWIRKDGENFSAAQVARLLQEHSDVVLAAAYGVPCPVSDEWVMAALKLRDGAAFDVEEFFRFCERQVESGGMDRKWFPDFVRIVDEFPYTETQKILVRSLKQQHFDRRRVEQDAIFFRRRGDDSYREFKHADYDSLRREFDASERVDQLDR
jgi:fatty-acyl-CoA synthase